MKLVLEIKDEDKAQSFIELLKDMPYVKVREKGEGDSRTKIKRIPAEFRNPVSVEKYIHISRDDIYEDRLH